MNKTTEIKYEIFGEVLRKAKDLTEIALVIKNQNEDLESALEMNDAEGKNNIMHEISNNELEVYFLLESILQKLGTLEDLQEILKDSLERELFDLNFELNYKNKDGK